MSHQTSQASLPERAASSDDFRANFYKLIGALVFLFVSLGGTLAWVRASLTENSLHMTELVVPTQASLEALSSAVSHSVQRQARIISTPNKAALEQIADASTMEAKLDAARTRIAEAADAAADQAEGRSLGESVDALAPITNRFVATDRQLFESVARRHDLHERFEARIGDVGASTHDLLTKARSFLGVVQLAYVAEIRQLDRGARRGNLGGRTATSIVEITRGDTRAMQSHLGDMVDAVLQLSVIAGKVGLARNDDELNSIVANEVPPAARRIERSLDDLVPFAAIGSDAAARLAGMREVYARLLAQAFDTSSADSLVGVRRAVFAESRNAEALRTTSGEVAEQMRGEVDRIRKGSMAMASRLQAAADRTNTLARWLSVFAGLVGVVLCAMAGRRIYASTNQLRSMNGHLEKLKDDLTEMNENLEHLVDERTAELVERRASMQRVLDSMGDGLLSLDVNGKILPDRSAAVEAWFGRLHDDRTKAWNYLFGAGSAEADQFELVLQEMGEGILPFECYADLLPKRLERGELTLEMRYRPIEQNDDLTGVVVAISDATAKVQAERLDREAKEVQALVSQLLSDRKGFTDFMDEGRRLIAQIERAVDVVHVKRPLHTLKGNTAVLGMSSVSLVCHRLEEAIAERELVGESGAPTPAERESISAAWDAAVQRISHFLDMFDGDASREIAVSRGEYDVLLSSLESIGGTEAVLELVRGWLLQPTRDALKRLAAHAERIAVQLGRPVEVEIRDGGVRLDAERHRELWASLVHVIRNALAHGIETPEERTVAGKSPLGKIVLQTYETPDGHLQIVVADDGRGIDWEAVRTAARARGLDPETTNDLRAALFYDGLSTMASADELAGRGVGMSAVKEAVAGLGGAIEVSTQRGEGTQIRLDLPTSQRR